MWRVVYSGCYQVKGEIRMVRIIMLNMSDRVYVSCDRTDKEYVLMYNALGELRLDRI